MGKFDKEITEKAKLTLKLQEVIGDTRNRGVAKYSYWKRVFQQSLSQKYIK